MFQELPKKYIHGNWAFKIVKLDFRTPAMLKQNNFSSYVVDNFSFKNIIFRNILY